MENEVNVYNIIVFVKLQSPSEADGLTASYNVKKMTIKIYLSRIGFLQIFKQKAINE